MLSDSGNLLRALLYVQTEAARLGYADASEHLARATQIIASSLNEDRRTVLNDKIFDIVEKMARSRQGADDA